MTKRQTLPSVRLLKLDRQSDTLQSVIGFYALGWESAGYEVLPLRS